MKNKPEHTAIADTTEAERSKAEEAPETRELSADDIIAAQDIVIERVEVPEWGGHIYVRAMTAAARERYIESVRKTEGKGRNAVEKIQLEDSSAKLVQNTACNKLGSLLFTSAHIKKLAAKSSKAMQRVVDAASRLNGLDDDAEQEAKNVLAKSDQTEGSNTDSQVS